MRQQQVRARAPLFTKENQSYQVHPEFTTSLNRPPRANSTAMNELTRLLEPKYTLGLAKAERCVRVGRIPPSLHLLSPSLWRPSSCMC